MVASGGLLCPASCSSHIDRKTFLATVEEGSRAAGRRFSLETIRGAGFDHPVAPWFPEGDYLKFAIGRVEGGGRGSAGEYRGGGLRSRCGKIIGR